MDTLEIKDTRPQIIYKATNLVNGKGYVGKTVQGLFYRKRAHLYKSRQGSAKYLYCAIRKYGEENFSWEEIDTAIDNKEASEKEKLWISFYRTNEKEYGYNLTAGGEGTSGYRHTAETKEKIRVASKNQTRGPERMAKLLETGKANKGKVRSEETRAKIREARKHQGCTEETRIKRSKAMQGFRHSEESKRKISEGHKGKKLSEAHIKHMSESRKGKFGIHGKQVICVETGEVFRSQEVAARSCGLRSGSSISQVCRGEGLTAGGFHWEYYRESA